MKELSLNILDISHNSIKAKASKITITVVESELNDLVSFEIGDDGCGMDEEFLSRIIDPFVTTRTTRKVGLGIPLVRQATIDTDGSFDIKSKVGVGTTLYASFRLTHLDRAPIGDMASTVSSLIMAAPDVQFVYTHKTDKGSFVFDTQAIKEELDGISLAEPEILMWISEYIKENLQNINGGNI